MAADQTQLAGHTADWPEPGQSYRDAVSGAVVLVLTWPQWPGVLRCDGVTMIATRPLPCSYRTGLGIGAPLRPGRRYRDPVSGLEVRCLRAGHGRLTYAGQALAAV